MLSRPSRVSFYARSITCVVQCCQARQRPPRAARRHASAVDLPTRAGLLYGMTNPAPRVAVSFLIAAVAAAFPAKAQVPAPLARDTVLWKGIIAAEDARADDMRSLDPIVRGLQSADPFIRRLAVRALGRFERPSLVFGIAPLMSD